LIRYVRDFIEIGDLDIFGQEKMYKVMMMASIEKQETSSIMEKFKVGLATQDPNVDYYINLVKDLLKNEEIFDTENKMVYIGKIVDLMQLISRSFREHLAYMHVCLSRLSSSN
jgi:hypothetical protein